MFKEINNLIKNTTMYKDTEQTKIYKDYYTPRSVVKCLIKSLNITGGKIYDPCCGTGAFLSAIKAELEPQETFTLYGQTISQQAYDCCKMNLAMFGQNKIADIKIGNTLSDDRFDDEQFDYVITNPPFNFSDRNLNTWKFDDPKWKFGPPPRHNANFAWLQHVIYHLNSNGRAAVILPTNTLRANGIEQNEIVKNIILADITEAIITFPKYLFSSTEIPFCVWIINKRKLHNNRILLIDASRLKPTIRSELTEDHINKIVELISEHRIGTPIFNCDDICAAVSTEDIAKNNYQLTPKLYIKSDFPLSVTATKDNVKSITEFLKSKNVCQTLIYCLKSWEMCLDNKQWSKELLLDLYSPSVGLKKNIQPKEASYPYVDIRTVIKNDILPADITERSAATDDEKIRFKIHAGDILLTRTSENLMHLGKCCVSLFDTEAVFGNFLKRLQPYPFNNINMAYACAYFQSAIYKKEIYDNTPLYVTRYCLNDDTLSKIHIYYPEQQLQSIIGNIIFNIYMEAKVCQDNDVLSALTELKNVLIELCITQPIIKHFKLESE